MKKKYYITTAIAYPNSRPHLGHALEIIQADAFARFQKLMGKEVFFQTGTDEHGIKNWQTAQKEGKDIIEFLDRNVSAFKELYQRLNVNYDSFVRTTDKKIHFPGAKKLWVALVNIGDIYKKKYKGLYCCGCEAFKTEKELVNDRCTNHPTKEIEHVEEENYFFKLSKYKDIVSEKIESDEYKVIPETRKNEILSFLKIAQDISFSRPKTSLPWGISVPGDEEQVMYVWCDALSNYITGIGYGRDDIQFNSTWPADVHIIGKDILRFHAAFWPAMLISANIHLPKTLFVHGFVLSKGEKMSKSTGNIIEPIEQIEKYGADQFRLYMLGAMPMDGDGDYNEEIFIERINTELVGNLSNFCYRVLFFTNKNFDSEISGIDDIPIINDLAEKTEEIKKAYERFDFKKVVEGVLAMSAIGNKYFQDNEPWKLVKTDKEKASRVIGLCVNIAKNLSIALEPIMPVFSLELQKQLNVKNLKWENIGFKLNNHKINQAGILAYKTEKKADKEFPLDMRVAKVIDVKEHPDAEKLYILQIDLGTEKRQIVARLREHYKPEELLNKKIIVLCNLKKAKLRGIESNGMLLAAEDEKNIGLLTAANSKVGKTAKFGNLLNSNKTISYEDFVKIPLIVKKGKVFFENEELKTSLESISAEKVNDGKVG